MRTISKIAGLGVVALGAALLTAVHASQMERLDRGLISVRSGSGNLVSWRWLAADPADVGFNVYRGATKVNATPITASTNYLDAGAAADAAYTVRAVVGGVEQAASGASLNFANGYLDVPIQNPPSSSAYAANDASVGDLDGDGSYEIVLKWDPPTPRTTRSPGSPERLRRRLQAQRHPAVADQPGPQHPGRRALHPVPGLRLRRRRRRRGGDEDRRRHRRRAPAGHRQRLRGLPQLQRLHPDRAGVPDHVQRPHRRRPVDRELRAAARHGLLLGRQLRQPRRPVPGRHRLPGRRSGPA
jgi:hypothetical protein